MHERLATGERGRFTPGGTARRRSPRTARWAGRTPGGWRRGARADLVAVRLDTPRTAGADPAQVVLAASAADVDTVVVGGRVVVSGGRHVLGDVGALLQAAIDAAVGGGHAASSSPASVSSRPTTRSWARPHDAAVVVEGDTIAWVGPAARVPAADRRLDVGGRAVVPGFVDSHTHLVFAGDRAAEFAARMRGARYDGGGIASTVAATRAADDATLRALLADRIAELRAQGTTTVEIKSGYGLTVADERRAVALAAEVTPEVTFLGAHVVPAGTRRADYLALVTGPMLGRLRAPRAVGRRVLRARQPARLRRRRGAARCCWPAGRPGWRCGCTATSSGRGRGSRWPSSSAPRASTTART